MKTRLGKKWLIVGVIWGVVLASSSWPESDGLIT